MKKKDKLVLGIGLFAMVLTIIIGTSYAYWKLSKVQEDRNIIATGCFNVEFTDGDGINLQDAYPISDEEGLLLTPYTFTITNTCDSYVSYQINLETLSQATGVKVLPDQYVRIDLKRDVYDTASFVLNSSKETTSTLTEATKAYKLYSHYLKPNESKTYNLRIWMDKDTPPLEETMNAFFSGKVTIDFSYMAKNPMENAGTLKKSALHKTYDVKKIVIQNELKPVETEQIFDLSEENDGSVMGYLVSDEEDDSKYVLYLQGDGGIYAPVDSSRLFNEFQDLEIIEGLEYLNTSKVTDMSYMFRYNQKLKKLDLSSFDTSKVTNMKNMFNVLTHLTSLDLSNFNTSNVTDMSSMFGDCRNLISLDLSNFNTSKVTNMNSMFYNCSSLTGLDLDNFDTSKVTNMAWMFNGCNNLINLNLSNFNVYNVEYLNGMFKNCINLENLNFNIVIAKAKNIGYFDSYYNETGGMFENCEKISATLNILTKNISVINYVFSEAATQNNTKIVVNYVEEASDLVDQMIATKGSNSNVVKGSIISKQNVIINVENISSDITSAYVGTEITLNTTESKMITAFKLNGKRIEGDKFLMPNQDAMITDIEMIDVIIVESDHNPYLKTGTMNDKLFYENTFKGAKSITVILDYQTFNNDYAYVSLYKNDGEPQKYGGTTRTKETIIIKGNYLKITFTHTSGYSGFYGFKATIIPNY